MTQVQITEYKSHSVDAFVSLTTSLWHKCCHQTFLHPLVERSITRMQFGQWHGCRLLSVNYIQSVHLCHWPPVNDTNAVWSVTGMQITEFKSHLVSAFVSLTMNADTKFLFAPSYRTVNDMDAVLDFINTYYLVKIEASDWSIAQNACFSLVWRSIRIFLKGAA